MDEDSKYDIDNTRGLLNPFTQVNIVMEKVFVSTKNHGVSIKELWDQIAKLKDHTGLNRTKDGINISQDYIPHYQDEATLVSEPNTKKNALKAAIKASDTSPNKEIFFDQDMTVLSNKNPDEKIEKLFDIINEQKRRIEKLESRLDYIGNRFEDKFDTHETNLNTLVKARVDDIENFCKTLENRFNKSLEDQKEKDYNIEKALRDRINEIEISIRKLKRNMLMGADSSINISVPDPSDPAPKMDLLSPKTKGLPTTSDPNGNPGTLNFLDEVSPKNNSQNAQNSVGLMMVWDEIDKLRAKFDDCVHCEDFDDIADKVDDLYDRLHQVVKQGKFEIEEGNRLDEEFSASENGTPIADEQLDQMNEDVKDPQIISSKSIRKAVTKINTDFDNDGKSPSVSPFTENPGIKKQSTSIKDLSPTKFSNYKRSNRGGGQSKTIQEVRKIVEKWPKLEETIEELKSSEKLNYKNIYKVGETLAEFKKEMQESFKKRTNGLYNTIMEENQKLEAKILDLFNTQGIASASETLKTLDLRVEKLTLQFDSVHKANKDLKAQLAELQEMAGSPFGNILGNDNNMVDEVAINDLKESIDELKKNLNKVKSDLYKSLKEMDAKLLKKVDEEVVSDLEEALHQGIDQVMTSSAKKFADRRDTNKAIRLLEQNMKNMYDLFISRDDGGGEANDAMLARKHPGFTCMSCEKSIVNMEGKIADFNSWGKMPYRDPSERMLRVGHGFSKMLSQLKPDLTKITENKGNRPSSGRNLSLDPEAGKRSESKMQISSSLMDLNKIDSSQLSATNKIKKVSKIKVSKSISKESKPSSVKPKKEKAEHLPKIESAKGL